MQSVCGQTYRELEIITVDDGSTDGSAELLDRIAEGDSRIRVIHQPNGGVSVARNRGILAANGDYIAFSDSDDVMGSRNVEYLVQAAVESGAGLCVSTRYQAFCNDAGADIPQAQEWSELKFVPFSVQEGNAPILKETGFIWGNLYAKRLIKDYQILFDNKIGIREDALFNVVCQVYASRYVLVNGPVTFYRQREGSITTKCTDLVWEAESQLRVLEAFPKTHPYDQSKWAYLNRRIWVNGFYDTFCRMDPHQKKQIAGFEWRKTKFTRSQINTSDLSAAEKVKECILSSPAVENRVVYPLLIHFRRLKNG